MPTTQTDIEHSWALADKARRTQRISLYAAMVFGAIGLLIAALWPGSPFVFVALAIAIALTLVQLVASIRSQLYERRLSWLLLALAAVCATASFVAVTLAVNAR